MALQIDDLLKALQNPLEHKKKGNFDDPDPDVVWSRISSGDKFEELGLKPSELDSFLKEWIDQNPYNNI